MTDIIKLIITQLGSKLAEVIITLLKTVAKSSDAIKEFFSYKKVIIQKKTEEQQDTKIKEYEKEVDRITDSGTLEDLINLRKKK